MESDPLPGITVVVEGYNEWQLSTDVADTLEFLAAQEYPLDRVDVVLTAVDAQVDRWTSLAMRYAAFRSIGVVAGGDPAYYVLKNAGAAAATNGIVAFVDSDVRPSPGWLRAIAESIGDGADATVGPTEFFDRRGHAPRSVVEMAGSLSWGHVMGKPGADGKPRPMGLSAHNLAVRSAVFADIPFDDGAGRIGGWRILFDRLRAAGLRIDYVSAQRVRHSFSPRWFFFQLKPRTGYEEWRLRRVDADVPNRWMRFLGPIEPLATAALYIAVDLETWPRYAREIGVGGLRRIALMPALGVMSVAARTAFATGMYAGMLFPRRMAAWAERH
jgi:glycosyltransferase involved in cell wall biosynthesis